MGNENLTQSKFARSKVSRDSRQSKNSYSFDSIAHRIKLQQKIMPDSHSKILQPYHVTNELKSQIKVSQNVALDRNESKQQNQQKLSKLNLKNDELRKQLIKISSLLSEQLQKKKFEAKPQIKNIDQQSKKTIALKKQLQNAYRQIDRYKKMLAQIKKNEQFNSEDSMNQYEAKINKTDKQIKQVQNEIESLKNIEKNQQIMIKKVEEELNNPEIKQFKNQIQKLKDKLKKGGKYERKKIQKQRFLQEYMFQLQRRFREMNGEYLPELKSYSNKNFQPENKYQKDKKKQAKLYKPAAWQIKDAEEEVSVLKEKHEQYHKKIQKALKQKGDIHALHLQIKQNNGVADKTLETLKYKKDRYLQLVMSNLQFLMNEDQPLLNDSDAEDKYAENGVRVITKGKDFQTQVIFDDHNCFQGVTLNMLRIVSINIWFTNKKQISCLQAIYANGKQFFLGKRSAQNSQIEQKQSFQVDEGDYIKNIMGSFSKKGAIQFLAFNSGRGKAKQFGKQMVNGLNFSLSLSKNERPVCLSGCSFFDGQYWKINKLIVDVVSQK